MREGYRRWGAIKKILFGLLLVLLALASFAGAFLLLGGLQKLPFFRTAPPAWRAGGDALAMRLAAPPAEYGKTELEAYYDEAIAFAKANDFNTLVFEAKQGLTVWWRDGVFPPAPGIARQDENFLKRHDPLMILCERLEGQEIQLWVEVDPYATLGYPGAESKAKAAKLAEEKGGEALTAFAAGDIEYSALLVESLAKLPVRYPVAGIVLAGFGPDAWGVGAEAGFAAGFENMVTNLHAALAEEGRLIPLVLRWDEQSGNSLMQPETAQSLVATGVVEYLMPALDAGQGLQARMEEYAQSGAKLVPVQPADDVSGLFYFLARQSAGYGGMLWGDYAALNGREDWLALVKTVDRQVEGAKPGGFEIPQTLDVTYPVEGTKLTWEGVYMTGHSNPEEPLLLNGNPVEDRAANGAFGVFVPLAMGDNTFTLQNGAVTASKTITRVAPSGGGGSGGSQPGSDGTKSVKEGQAVRIVSPFTSALKTYNDFYSVNETFVQGGVLVVHDSQRFLNGSNYTYSYQLSSGEWIWAGAVTAIAGDGKSNFTGLQVETSEEHRGEYIIFEGTGTPAPYIAYGNSTGILSLTMYDTEMTVDEGFFSGIVSGAEVEPFDGGVILHLQTHGLWGYNMEYTDGQTRLFLKRKPGLFPLSDQPLTGVHVMLDPGHGEQAQGANYGAVGIAGPNGYPHEKDINLQLAQATAYRLRQLGATVTFTKEDDTNPGINERFTMQQQAKPDFFLSIHHDGLDGNVDLTGSSNVFGIYYHPYNVPPSEGFARALTASVSRETGRRMSDVRWGNVNYGVIRTTVCPSVLFEYGLIVTPEHYDGATSAEGIWRAAFGTAEAVMAMVEWGFA